MFRFVTSKAGACIMDFETASFVRGWTALSGTDWRYVNTYGREIKFSDARDSEIVLYITEED